MRSLAPGLLVLLLAGCTKLEPTGVQPGLNFFGVRVKGAVYASPLSPIPGSGTATSPYEFPKNPVRLQIEVQALDEAGQLVPSFDRPTYVWIKPGQVTGLSTLTQAFSPGALFPMSGGKGEGYVTADHIFGSVVILVQDAEAPPKFSPPVDPTAATAGAAEVFVSIDSSSLVLGDNPITDGEVRISQGVTPVANATFGLTTTFGQFGDRVGDSVKLRGQSISLVCDAGGSARFTLVAQGALGNAAVTATYLAPDGSTVTGVAYVSMGMPGRTFVAGASQPVYFGTPTLADLQRFNDPTLTDNRLSPFQGNFLTVEKGDMLVTSITPDGFYVSDLSAQKPTASPWNAFPGHFGQIFVYNYSYPDNLLVGDHLISVTGTIQEFSGHTQMVFPSWVKRDGFPTPQKVPAPVRIGPYWETTATATVARGTATVTPAAMDGISLGQGLSVDAGANRETVVVSAVTPTSFTASFAKAHGGTWTIVPVNVCGVQSLTSAMDQLCAYSNKNLAVESLESALVKVTSVVPTNEFVDCDMNGDAKIAPFRYFVPTIGGAPDFTQAYFGCREVAPPFPATEATTPEILECECNASCVLSTCPKSDPSCANPHTGKICSERTTFKNYGQWQVLLDAARGTRINVSTRDALPDFDPSVLGDPQWANVTLDVTGILRQVQAARPRWLIAARDADDICCRPANPANPVCPPGLKPCTGAAK